MEGVTIAPIAPNEPLAERVANSLRDAILAGQLSPGDKLSVPEVARRLGVSRTPAREALLILERDGLVENKPRFGAEVVRGDFSDLTEMLDIRESLDGMAARLAALRMSPEEKRSLKALLKEHEAALDVSDMSRHVDLDMEFHRHLRDGSRNKRLIKQMIGLERQIQLLMNLTANAPGFVGRATMRDHTAIVKAIVAGNPDAAEEAARSHVQRTRHFCAILAGGRDPNAKPFIRAGESWTSPSAASAAE